MKMLLALTMVLVMGLSFDALAKPQRGQGGAGVSARVEQGDGKGACQRDGKRQKDRKGQRDGSCQANDGYGGTCDRPCDGNGRGRCGK